MHLGFFLSVVSLAGAPAPKRDNALILLDWNIHKGHKLAEIGETLRALRPDVCLLQEVDANARRTSNVSVADRLAADLGYTPVFAPAFQELSQGRPDAPAWNGQAVLTKIPISRVRRFRFQAQTGFWKPRRWIPNTSLFQRRLGGRVAQVVELKAGSGKLVIYNLHLESRSARARMAQLEEVLADARRYDAVTPVVLAGDLNTQFDGAGFARKMTEAGFHSCFGDERPRTHRIIGALDWILVRGPVQCDGAAVHRGSGASDHDPLTARLVLTKSLVSRPESIPRNATRGGPAASRCRRG